MEEKQQGFWAICSLMGHTTLAGYLDEYTIGGSSFLRITIPETKNQAKWQRLFTSGSVYSIDPVTEEVATLRAQSLNAAPMEYWSARTMITKLLENEGKMLAPSHPQESEGNFKYSNNDDDDYTGLNEEQEGGIYEENNGAF